MASNPRLNVDGLPGGKVVGAGVGAGAGSGYGALAGGAACIATGPFMPLCLLLVVPVTTTVGAVTGGVVGAVRTESIDAVALKTKSLAEQMMHMPYHDTLARQLAAELRGAHGVEVARVAAADAKAPPAPIVVTEPPASEPGVVPVEEQRPWQLDVGVTEVGAEGNREFALRLIVQAKLRRDGVVVWETTKRCRARPRSTSRNGWRTIRRRCAA